MYEFKDKTVLVTGGSRGIGKALVEAFAANGANVVINYVSSEASANELVDRITKAGGNAVAFQADVSKFIDAQRLVEKTIEAFGKIDVLINNSGITKDNLMLRMTEEDFDRVIDVNLKGTWNMCKHITRHFLKNKQGSIINITSVVGLIGNPGQSNYVASKAGVIGLTKTLAKEFGSRHIRVNAVAPGFIETEMTSALSEDVRQLYLGQIPLNRFGTVEDIANACLYLASDKASYITGQVISVNGGMI
ncbi:MAG TPA: 3-oxoacyl-[acyl-carrier-protein] reductase [Bacillota bacterium]|nr:3-oxoacyl-[acyl-carrier-protein] reductase [Bacillota bacterium]HPJ23446.1 3-oxoacyl-[acyl-carrier-protein] reductase [Bacillota bacterium]